MTEANSNIASTLHIGDEQTTRGTSSECKVCEAPARYCYFGAIVCESCKMFFKRNAKTKKGILLCQFNNHCTIDVSNRQTCPCCRLTKCFANGMSIELIRSPHTKKIKKNHRKKSTNDSTSKNIAASVTQNQLDQIPVLNILQSDQSILSADQWNLVSYVIHCFEEYTGNLFVQHLIQGQDSLPLDSYFHCSSVKDFLTSMKSKIHLAFEKNRASFSLNSHNRIALIRSTVQYTTSLGELFTIRQHKLLNYPSFYKCIETIYGSTSVSLAKIAIDQLDSDNTFIKLVLATLAFSTTKYTIYKENNLINLIDIKEILTIQDMYTEITWRYLLFKYNYGEAVRRFSNLIRFLFYMTKFIVEAYESEQYKEMINAVIEQTEQTLCL